MNTDRSATPAPACHRLCLALSAFLLAFSMLLAIPAPAQEQAQAPATIDQIEKELDALSRQADKSLDQKQTDEALRRAGQVQSAAAALASAQSAPIAALKERVALLGEDAAQSNDPSLKSDARRMERDLASAEAIVQRARLAELDAQQLVAKLNFDRAQTMGRELAARDASPLGPDLWADAGQALPKELRRAQSLPSKAPPAEPATQALSLAGWALLCALLLIPVRKALIRGITAVAQRKSTQHSAFAISTYALARTLTTFALVWCCIWLLRLTLRQWPLDTMTLALVLTASSAVSTYLMFTSLGHSLAMPLRPAHPTAKPARKNPAVLVVGSLALGMASIAAGAMLEQRLMLGQASQAALHAVEALIALGFLSAALLQAARLRALAAAGAPTEQHARFAMLGVVLTLSWLFVGALAVAWVLGYINLTEQLIRWSYWTLVVIGAAWLLMQFVDALCLHVGAAWKARARYASGSKVLEQIAVLLSAVLRLLILALACGALLVPFGAGFTSVLELFALMAKGFEVGGVSVSATALLRAALAVALVMGVFKLIRWWMVNSYLPTTSLQADARSSVERIVHYLGLALAALWGMTAFGIGMEKVAILASALSVGIGFGLQAITQNFVSGLILLVERPVKIGDWIKLGTMEGDVKRINVRSTEIAVSDHSTLIVPNSELITKVVQNMTPQGARGRAQLMFSVDVKADLDRAIEIVRGVYAQDQAVLEVPAPAVFLDRIEAGTAVLNTFVHVASPRDAYGARSRLLLAVLKALRQADIEAGLPPQQISLTPQAGREE
jgi:small-conductance mechanosensitive channel